VFLDDLAPGDLSSALGTPVRAVEPKGATLVGAMLGR
jgi:hypothetical protein